jgi:hypothetical protein
MKGWLRGLEEMVVDAWPAAEVEELGGWLLRDRVGPCAPESPVTG